MTEKQQSGAGFAWIGHPPAALAELAGTGLRYAESDDFLLSPDAYRHALYLVDLVQRGVPGIDLVRLIRKRSRAGVIVLSPAPHVQLALALESGADQVLDRDSPAADVAAAMAALRRRLAMAPTRPPAAPWRLREQQALLLAPDGTEIMLSRSDVTVLSAFARADGGVVDRRDMTHRLWGPQATDRDGALHAALYRLRRKVEQSGQPVWPAHAVAGVGYTFRAPLLLA